MNDYQRQRIRLKKSAIHNHSFDLGCPLKDILSFKLFLGNCDTVNLRSNVMPQTLECLVACDSDICSAIILSWIREALDL